MTAKQIIEKYSAGRWWWLILIAVVLAVFGSTFWNQWTYDDFRIVTNNPDTYSFKNFLINQTPGRPLRELTYLLERYFFSTRPAGYHILQLSLHAANGIILAIIMNRCGISRYASIIGACFFIIHPYQTETVASIGHRKELLAFFFGILSLLTYQSVFNTQKQAKRFLITLAATILYLISLTGNVTAISFPLIWLAFEYFFIKEDKYYLLKYKSIVGFVVVSGIAIGLYKFLPLLLHGTNLIQIYNKNNYFPDTTPFLPHFMGILTSFYYYIIKLFYPHDLAVEYITPLENTLFQPKAILGLLFLTVIIITLYKNWKSRPEIAFALCWFLMLYAPISNIIPVNYYNADRYMYMPLAGVAIAVGYLITRHYDYTKFAMIMLLLFSILTVRQNLYWLNNFTLWERFVTVNPTSSSLQAAAADGAFMSRNFDKALYHAKEAIRINPYYSKGFLTLAMIQDFTGDYKNAEINYKLFISKNQQDGFLDTALPFVAEKLQIIYSRKKGENK